jgi:hypothetical protein
MKFKDVRLDDTPDSSNPYRIRSIPIDVRFIRDVLKGGYNVHPQLFPYSLLHEVNSKI